MRLQNQLALQGLFLALRAPQAEEPTLLLAEACSSVPGWLSILRIWASPQGVHPPSAHLEVLLTLTSVCSGLSEIVDQGPSHRPPSG